jgi:hypothetical protein
MSQEKSILELYDEFTKNDTKTYKDRNERLIAFLEDYHDVIKSIKNQ